MHCLPKPWLGFLELQIIKAIVQKMEKEIGSSFAWSLEAGPFFSKEVHDKIEANQRSIYVGNLHYEATAEELESFFLCCGKINRVTILCDRFSGHSRGCAYIEFEEQSSTNAAIALDKSLFRGRIIKVQPKRIDLKCISTTTHGGCLSHFQAWRRLTQWGSNYGWQDTSTQGREHRSLVGGLEGPK
ncbi:polyadenylate-binding protein 2 [Melopsittacus undulatus]|uniref:polyadenylate-binding protein 2 n=1 Tax=Melopsittacus undulatus TaxID=13146 RepID=UPI0003833F8F|nr:polyadenylate-binding protein 2 [Melopsittacus undulatus]